MYTFRRHALGVIAVVMVASGLVMLGRNGWRISEDSETLAASILIRAGLTMAAVWLAFPQLVTLFKKVPLWVIGVFFAGGIALVVQPKVFMLVLPVLGAVGIMQFVKWLFKPLPNQNKRAAQDSETSSKPSPEHPKADS